MEHYSASHCISIATPCERPVIASRVRRKGVRLRRLAAAATKAGNHCMSMMRGVNVTIIVVSASAPGLLSKT